MSCRPLVTAERVRDLLDYEPETGVLRWRRAPWPSFAVGAEAGGRPRRDGYRAIGLDRRKYLVHRIIWLHVHGRWPIAEIDHVDGDPSNNRLCNLREANSTQNKANVPVRRHNKCGLKGACWNPAAQSWQAKIKVQGKDIYLGIFRTAEEAHAAYVEAAQSNFGAFARVK